MSSDLAATVASLQLGNYLGLVIPTAVVYDYIVTLPEEINYIWLRPWSVVSLIFFIVRYLGLILAALDGLYETTFIPGPILVRTVLDYLDVIAFTIFLAASDVVMILRVYAMWSKSKTVLGVLLVFYVSEVILFSASAAYYHNSTNMTMTIVQVLNMSFCNPINNSTNRIGAYKFIPRITLSALLVILAVGRLCIEAFQSYRTTKQLQINRYIKLLVREGVLYFVAHLLYIIDFGQSLPGTITTLLATIAMYIISPRFIMSVRGLYTANVIRGSGRNSAIDSGFGIGKDLEVFQVSTVGFAHSVIATSKTTEEDVEMQDLL